MKAKVIQEFYISGMKFKKGNIIDIPISVFHKLSSRGLVKPYHSDVLEVEKPIPSGESLNRKCVVCGSDSWKRAKPKGSTLITCLHCNHSELYIEYKRPTFDELKRDKNDR